MICLFGKTHAFTVLQEISPFHRTYGAETPARSTRRLIYGTRGQYLPIYNMPINHFGIENYTFDRIHSPGGPPIEFGRQIFKVVSTERNVTIISSAVVPLCFKSTSKLRRKFFARIVSEMIHGKLITNIRSIFRMDEPNQTHVN